MKITFFNILKSTYNNPLNKFFTTNPNSANIKCYPQLTQDTVSFKGNNQKLKKSDFSGIDLSFIENQKIDISKFKTHEDLQLTAKNLINEKIINNDFVGRREETQRQRKAILKAWTDYVTKENDVYTPVMQFLILSSITKYLKHNSDKLPPVLNKGILAETMQEVVEKSNENPKENINILNLYNKKLNKLYYATQGEAEANSDFTGWIVIPSQKHDIRNFRDNVNKLQTLSHDNWCTKSLNAEPYLKDGDFHIFIENGKTVIGIRFLGDKIEEIQGECNNTKLPIKYADFIKTYVKDNNFSLSKQAKKEFSTANKIQKEIKRIRKALGEDAISKADATKILPYFGINVEKDKKGQLTIDEYKQPHEDYGYEDIGIDENKLFKNIVKIENRGDFHNSQITDLGKLKEIGGVGNFEDSKIQSLGKLRKIGSHCCIQYSKIKDLGELREIGGDANFNNSKITSLGKLRKIGERGNFADSDLENLGALKEIGDAAFFNGTKIEDLGNLEKIGGWVDFSNTKLKSTGRLKYIGNDVFVNSTAHKDMLKNVKIKGQIILLKI